MAHILRLFKKCIAKRDKKKYSTGLPVILTGKAAKQFIKQIDKTSKISVSEEEYNRAEKIYRKFKQS